MAGGMENVLQSLQVLPGVAGPNDEDGKLAVRGAGPEHNLIVLDGVQIHNAQRLGEFTTGAALRCVDGPSIRLAAGTAAAFESAGRLRLIAGAIYVDSDPEHAANALVVVTAFGTVRHVGTQFELRLQQASLDIRVREGEVSIESAAGV